MSWMFWRTAPISALQGSGVRSVTRRDQLPPGARIEYPEGQPYAEPLLPHPEEVARMAMEGYPS